MRATHHNLWTFCRFAHFHDVCLNTTIWLWLFVRNLLCLWQKGFHFAQVEQGVALIDLLNDARDNVTFTVCILFEFTITFCFADALTHDLAESNCRDTAKFFFLRRVVAFVDPVAVVVEVIGRKAHVEVVGIDFNDDFVGCAWALFVCRGQSLYKYL